MVKKDIAIEQGYSEPCFPLQQYNELGKDKHYIQ